MDLDFPRDMSIDVAYLPFTSIETPFGLAKIKIIADIDLEGPIQLQFKPSAELRLGVSILSHFKGKIDDNGSINIKLDKFEKGEHIYEFELIEKRQAGAELFVCFSGPKLRLIHRLSLEQPSIGLLFKSKGQLEKDGTIFRSVLLPSSNDLNISCLSTYIDGSVDQSLPIVESLDESSLAITKNFKKEIDSFLISGTKLGKEISSLKYLLQESRQSVSFGCPQERGECSKGKWSVFPLVIQHPGRDTWKFRLIFDKSRDWATIGKLCGATLPGGVITNLTISMMPLREGLVALPRIALQPAGADTEILFNLGAFIDVIR